MFPDKRDHFSLPSASHFGGQQCPTVSWKSCAANILFVLENLIVDSPS